MMRSRKPGLCMNCCVDDRFPSCRLPRLRRRFLLVVALLLSCVSSVFAAAGDLYPQGTNFCFTFYSTKDPDSLHSLANGSTAIGPYYGEQSDDLANAITWDTKILYKVEPPSMAGLGPGDFDAPGFVWPSDATVSNEVAAIVSAVQGNASIAIWDVEPEELRPWKPAEMHYLHVVSEAIRANDPGNRPVCMYQPNNRSADQLATTLTSLDICLKGTYVNTVNGGAFLTNRIWARWSMEQTVDAVAAGHSNAVPWIGLWMAADPPPGYTTTSVTNWCRHDAYMGLIVGGKGLQIWSGFRGRTGFSDTYFDAYLGGYLTVAQDLNGAMNLAPVFLYGQTQTNATMAFTGGPATQTVVYKSTTNTYPSITYRQILHNGSNYLFLVNSAETGVDATFSGLPATRRMDLFEGTHAPTPGGSFSLTVPPLGVRAFRFDQPLPSEPPVLLTGVNVTGDNIHFQFSGTLGQHYRIEFATELSAPSSWQVVTDVLSLATSPFEVSHPMTNGQAFYRVGWMP